MGLCKNLNCCSGDKSKKDPNPKENGTDKHKKQNDNADSTRKPFNPTLNEDGNNLKDEDLKPGGTADSCGNGDDKKVPVYAQVQKKKLKNADNVVIPPKKADFLVSFVVDSRGGAMTGHRGSGLRVILPPGAVEQPVRVMCRFIRPHSHNLPYPPPIMERDALASGIIEVGPTGTKFLLPVLVEIPYFASLGQGERELIVLRSEDGEIWKEHELNTDYSDTDVWKGEEGELYMDVVNQTHLDKAVDALDTRRIVRLSTMSFPKYFAVLARVKGEVRTIGPEGGQISAKTPKGTSINVTFPESALIKRIKIGLQLQNVPSSAIKLMDQDDGIIDVYPLIGIYPRRRKTHHPIEVSIPVISEDRTNEVKKIWIMCSLSTANERAVWEDVSDAVAISIKGKRLVFETKATALFWLITCSKDYSSDRMVQLTNSIYKELIVSPYIARLTIFHRRSFPYAWCDALRIYLAVNDRMESYLEQKDDNWRKVLDGKELEVNDRCIYRFDCEGGDMVRAPEWQLEAKLDDRLVFKAFHECSFTLLVQSKNDKSAISSGTLVMKQQSNIPGATRRDVYRHSSWELDFGGKVKMISSNNNNVTTSKRDADDYETMEVTADAPGQQTDTAMKVASLDAAQKENEESQNLTEEIEEKSQNFLEDEFKKESCNLDEKEQDMEIKSSAQKGDNHDDEILDYIRTSIARTPAVPDTDMSYP